MNDDDAPVADCCEAVFGLRHMALRNALYHEARYRFLDGINRWFNFMVIVGGTGTAAQLAKNHPDAAVWLGGSVAVIGALQLVFDCAGRAYRHDTLQRRYYELLAEIDCELSPTSEVCARWKADISRISADEPPTKRALDAVADNQATNALIGGDRPRLKITKWQSLTRQLFAHNSGAFPVDPGWRKRDIDE